MRSQITRSLAPVVLPLAALALALVAPPATAETLVFRLDPAATTIEFTFGATLHSVTGTLRAKEGEIRIDPATGQATGRIVIDGQSAETGNDRRDEKMHEKILETVRFPEMVFEVQRVSGDLQRAGRSEVILHGTLEMHGVERPLDLISEVVVDGDRVRATGKTTIAYLDWGMVDPSFFVLRVAKEVELEVTANGRLPEAAVQTTAAAAATEAAVAPAEPAP